ncbi:MAG: NAD-dependent epimerase/dehydratase family protein [Candidatus Methylomirabilales bacterium]
MKSQPLHILVTGGAGFVGSHVVDEYHRMGHRVTVVDNLSTGRMANLNARAQFFPADIRSASLETIFQQGRFDIVNHHAAHIDLRRSVADPWHDAEVNILGTLNLLECARRFGVKRVIFASTGGAFYGDGVPYPTPESHAARPLSPYGVAKLTVEHYLRYYQGVHNLCSVVLRYANVYGPRQDPYGEAGVVAIFIERLLKGDPPVIHGDGHQTRDFVFVGDVVRANLLALDYLKEDSVDSDALVVNIGTGQELSVNGLFHRLKTFQPSAPEPIYGPRKSGEQRRSAIDPSYAKRTLGWEALVPLEEGLRKTWDWFKERSG